VNFDVRVLRDRLPSFFGALGVDGDLARQDHRLRFLARFGEATLDEEQVEALAWGFGRHSVSCGARARRRKLKILGAAKDQEFGDGAEAVGAVTEGLQFGDGLVGQFAGDFVRAGQAKHCGIGGLLLGDVLACGFAQRGRRFLDVEDVVCDLERPADGFAEAAFGI